MAYLSNILTYFKSSTIPGTQEQPFCDIYIIRILFVLYLLYLWRVIKQKMHCSQSYCVTFYLIWLHPCKVAYLFQNTNKTSKVCVWHKTSSGNQAEIWPLVIYPGNFPFTCHFPSLKVLLFVCYCCTVHHQYVVCSSKVNRLQWMKYSKLASY